MEEKIAKRILVVEDNPRILLVIQRRLESAGYSVITAQEGPRGLEMAKSERPDLILLDLTLPKLDGFEVCRLLKRDPAYSQIPIIMLTARTEANDVGSGLRCGADHYMTKPFDHAVLLGQMANLLAKAERTRNAQGESSKI